MSTIILILAKSIHLKANFVSAIRRRGGGVTIPPFSILYIKHSTLYSKVYINTRLLLLKSLKCFLKTSPYSPCFFPVPSTACSRKCPVQLYSQLQYASWLGKQPSSPKQFPPMNTNVAMLPRPQWKRWGQVKEKVDRGKERKKEKRGKCVCVCVRAWGGGCMQQFYMYT